MIEKKRINLVAHDDDASKKYFGFFQHQRTENTRMTRIYSSLDLFLFCTCDISTALHKFLGTKIGFDFNDFDFFTFDASSYVEPSDQSVRNFVRIAHT